MKVSTCLCGIMVTLLLNGCAGEPSVISRSNQALLQSMQLFNGNGSPRFDFYLSCTINDASCINVNNAFFDWANRRHVELHLVDRDDQVFDQGQPSHGSPDGTLPYRIAVQFAPVIIPSYDESGGPHGNMAAGFTPPKVTYTATLEIFRMGTGKPLLNIPVHEQRTADPKADAGSYLRAEVDTFVGSLEHAGEDQQGRHESSRARHGSQA